MSIVTCTAKTQNDLSVSRIVIEVLAQSWGYKCSVTYNDDKSFDIMVRDGAEDTAILQFKRLCPNLDIYKSDKKAMTAMKTESRRKMKKESSKMIKDLLEPVDYAENAFEYVSPKSGWLYGFDCNDDGLWGGVITDGEVEDDPSWMSEGFRSKEKALEELQEKFEEYEKPENYASEFRRDSWDNEYEESTSRKRIREESEFKSLSRDDRYEYADAGDNAEILHSDIGEFIYEPGSDFTEGKEITDAYLIDDDYNTSDFTKDGDCREEAKKISKMSFEDAVRYCKENGWKSYF